MTMVLWVKYSSTASRAIALTLAFNDTMTGDNSVDIELTGSGGTIGAVGAGGPPAQNIVVATAPSVNTWHCIVYTQTGSVTNLYIDGTLAATGSNPSQSGAVGTLRIGSYNAYYPTPYWLGLIDDVRIYNRALSASEIAAMYNGGK